MRAYEFISEDLEMHLAEINKSFKERNIIFESTKENKEVSEYIGQQSRPPIIGNEYYLVTLTVVPVPGAETISLAKILRKYKLVEIKSGQMLFTDTINGKERWFPQVGGPLYDKMHMSALFDSQDERDGFITLVFLRYHDWTVLLKTA